jgi:hypothetical protein
MLSQKYNLPRTAIQRRIYNIKQKVLHPDELEMNKNLKKQCVSGRLKALSNDSIERLKLVARIRIMQQRPFNHETLLEAIHTARIEEEISQGEIARSLMNIFSCH